MIREVTGLNLPLQNQVRYCFAASHNLSLYLSFMFISVGVKSCLGS